MHPLFTQTTAQPAQGSTPPPDRPKDAPKEDSASFQSVFDYKAEEVDVPLLSEDMEIADADKADPRAENSVKLAEPAPQVEEARSAQMSDPTTSMGSREDTSMPADKIPPLRAKTEGSFTKADAAAVPQEVEAAFTFHAMGMPTIPANQGSDTTVAKRGQTPALPFPIAGPQSDAVRQSGMMPLQSEAPLTGASFPGIEQPTTQPLVAESKTPVPPLGRNAVVPSASIQQTTQAQAILAADTKAASVARPILAMDAAAPHQMPAHMASVDPKAGLTPLPIAALPEGKALTQGKDIRRYDRVAPAQTFVTAQTASTLVTPPAATGSTPLMQWTAPAQFDAQPREIAEQRGFDLGLAPTRTEATSGTQAAAPTATARTDLPPQTVRQLTEAMAQAPGRPVEIALSPAELGRVRMMVNVTDTGVVVSLMAERPETLDLMRRNIDQLGHDFAALGYDNIAFSFGSSDADGQTEKDGAEPDNLIFASSKPTEDDAADAIPQITLRNGAETGLDLRL